MTRKRRKDKFRGTFEKLRDAVKSIGVSGHWEEHENPYCIKHCFRGKNGEVLNWWSSTGSLSFQGNDKRAMFLKEKLMPRLKKLEKPEATLDQFLS